MSDMNEYRRILRELAAAGSTDFINNSSMDHAAAMIEELFRNAKGKVCILTDHLHPNVYDRPELRKVVTEFLEYDGNEIEIVVQLNNVTEANFAENGFLQCLKRFHERVKIFKASAGHLKDLKNHFLVTKTTKGNFALRFETDITNHVATGTFNNAENGERLFDYFQSNIGNLPALAY